METQEPRLKFLIYGLKDTLTGHLRYIGRSVSGLRRPRQHFEENRLLQEPDAHKTRWIRKLKESNIRPEIVIIQEFEEVDMLDTAETFWISYFLKMGFDLVNKTSGGGTKVLLGKRSIEICRKLSHAHGISPEIEKEIVELYQSGLNSKEISRKVKKNASAILRIVRRNGVATRSLRQARGIKDPAQYDKNIIDMYNSGFAMNEIAKALGISGSGIQDLLRRNGVRIRSMKEAQQLRRRKEGYDVPTP